MTMFAALMIGDSWWLFMIPGLLLGLYAQMKLRSTYGRYVRQPTERGFTGAQAARIILDRSNLENVAVHEVAGHLTDHYDPTKRALFLSSENYHGTSMAALGVAAHEAGHALQHKAAYAPLHIRMALVPVANLASNAAMWITLLGYVAGLPMLQKFAPIAIAAFGAITLFQLVTLPVEFDASRRARNQLAQLGLVTAREGAGVAKVLNAAALTYVAAMVASVMQLLQILLIARSGERE